MALTEARQQPARRPLLRLPARVQAWLAGEHAAAQRMAGAAFVIRVGGAAIIFLSQVLLARWMGGFEFGTYVYAWTWVLLVGDIIHLGLPITAQRYMPEYTQRGEFDRLRGFLAGGRWMVFATGTAVAILGALAVHTLDRWLDRHIVLPLYLACVALPFYTLSNMLDGLARCYNAVQIALAAAVRAAAAHADRGHGGGACLRLHDRRDHGDGGVCLLDLDRDAAAARHARPAASHSVPAGPKSYDLRGWLATSVPILAVWAFYTLLTYTDVLVLRHFRPPEEVAHYYAAAKTLSLVAFIYFSVAAAAAHRLAAYHVAGDRDGLVAFASTTVRWTFWPSLAATALILALGKPLLWLFGPDFTGAYPLMFILAVSLIARASVGPAERMLNVMGEQRMCALVYACAFAINLAGAFLLAPWLGGLGVAIAMATAVVAELVLLFVVAKRRLGLHLFVFGAATPR